MSSEVIPGSAESAAIALSGVSKSYHVYERPQDRLKQVLFGARKTYYREFWALRDIDITVRKGEALALIGRNGAGKSTLLEIISSVLTPTTGTVKTVGRIAPLLQLGTSFNPEFTGHENISIAARILGLSDAEIEERERSIVEFAELGDFIQQPVRTYSSGMSARLAFAIAAHVSADILVVDEVLSVGDIGFSQKCARFLRDFRERGTLLFVSHDIGAVLALCDRAIWLDRGRIIEDAEPKRVVAHYATWIGDPSRSPLEFIAAEAGAQDKPVPAIAPKSTRDRPRGQPETHAEVSPFNWQSRSTGVRDASIVDAWFESSTGQRISTLNGGDAVVLAVRLHADDLILSPVLGFSIHDRLGQVMFAWDTSRDMDLMGREARPGDTFDARFSFDFPHLLGGGYNVILALAGGGADSGVQQHWMYEALSFHVTSSSLVQGLIGVPMHSVTLERAPANVAAATGAAAPATA